MTVFIQVFDVVSLVLQEPEINANQ